MYQVVAVGASRLKMAAFDRKRDAQDYAAGMAGDFEVVDEKTGRLQGGMYDGEWSETLTPTRREIL
jgi:hypothetical protein